MAPRNRYAKKKEKKKKQVCKIQFRITKWQNRSGHNMLIIIWRAMSHFAFETKHVRIVQTQPTLLTARTTKYIYIYSYCTQKC